MAHLLAYHVHQTSYCVFQLICVKMKKRGIGYFREDSLPRALDHLPPRLEKLHSLGVRSANYCEQVRNKQL